VARKVRIPYPGAACQVLNRGGWRGHPCRRAGPAALPENPGAPGQADPKKAATGLGMAHLSKT